MFSIYFDFQVSSHLAKFWICEGVLLSFGLTFTRGLCSQRYTKSPKKVPFISLGFNTFG
jgi:hypothetical protein